MKKSNLLNSNFSVKATKKQLLSLEKLFIQAGVKDDKWWNESNRDDKDSTTIMYYENDNNYQYHNHDCRYVCNNRTDLTYNYVRQELNKLIIK